MNACKRLALIGWMAWAGARLVSAAEPVPPASRPIEPVTTRHTSFSIPFRVDGPQSAPRSSVEVQLHVSEDRGVTWQLASRVSPEAGKFTFRAAQDGEYWFMVRTLDQQGVLRPDAPPAPELKVQVDTRPPQLELTVRRGEAGELHARWKAIDSHLQPSSLRISYQTNSGGDLWQDVAVDMSRVITAPDSNVGETTWWPDDRRSPIIVRAEVTDAAGNRTPTNVRIEGLAPPMRDMAERVITPLPEPAEELGPPQAVPWTAQPASNATGARATTPATTPPQMPVNFPGTSEALPPPQPDPASRPLRYTTQTKAEPAAPSRSSDVLPEPLPERVASKPATPDVTPATPENGTPPSPPFNPLAPDTSEVPERDLDAEANSYAGGILPPGVRPRMVNARRFELDYDVDSVGADGIGKIELWGTRDGGRSWTSYGADDDTRSPFVVTVNGEGLFGFRMVVETTTGLRGALPRPGDLPDVWVGVDTTKPQAKLTVAEPGDGARPGELGIRWEAGDALLAARPISLSFGESTAGPWTVFASGLENTGRYDWKLDNRVPDKIYLRLEVRDEAGNVQTFDLAEPVAADRVRPQGKILNVRPVGS